MNRVIFFGNGPLADATLAVLTRECQILFHARSKSDLEQVKQLKTEHESAFGILASFGVIIKQDLLDLFEPTGGIINLHPSLLPDLRGPSPIETAIARGDTAFGISVMKLVKDMDAGPLYHQKTLNFDKFTQKSEIYEKLATTGAEWLIKHLENLPPPAPQSPENATYCKMLDKSLSRLKPAEKPAERLQDEIRAYLGFPKSRYEFFGLDCIILETHISNTPENPLSLHCHDGLYLCIDRLQPAGKKPMDAKSFLNGYAPKNIPKNAPKTP